MKTVIVLIWRISSWKDHAWDFLAEKLWCKHLGISSSLRIIARERWISETRENLIQIGKEVTQKYGDGYLAEVLITKEVSDFMIVSGPRQLWQLEYLRKHSNSIFIGIEANEEIRYQRMLARWKMKENISFEKFLETEKLDEWDIQNVGRCLNVCDIIIENNDTLETFEEEILKISKNFLWKNHLKSS